MEPRKYQNDVIRKLFLHHSIGHKRQILCMSTGSGKTFVAASIILKLSKLGVKSVFIVNSTELVKQAVNHLASFGLRVGVLQGANTSWRREDQVLVATIQSIRTRGLRFEANFVIIDECHILHQAHIDLITQWNAVPILGLSATPLRAGLGKYFTNLVSGPTIKQLTADGFLVPVLAYAPTLEQIQSTLKDIPASGSDFSADHLKRAMNSKVLIGDIISTYQDKGEDRSTLCFCVDIAHSKQVSLDFQHEGINAVHLDAYTDEIERAEIIDDFKKGNIKILCSVNLLGIGFDCPIASCLILARPTLSLSLHIQYLGRGLRPSEGKENCIILDHSGNIARHGLPEDFEINSLDDCEKIKNRSHKKQELMKACPQCSMMIEKSLWTCPNCNYEKIPRQTKVYNIDGQLILVGNTLLPDDEWTFDTRRTFYRELKYIGQHSGYKPGYADGAYKGRFGEWPLKQWKVMTPLAPSEKTLRWKKHEQIKFMHRKHHA